MKLPIYNCYHPILREKTSDVSDFGEDFQIFAQNMLESMYAADGIGLAANQVGDKRSIVIVDEFAGDDASKHNPIFLVNPKITHFSDDEVPYREGCLSIPLFYEEVMRPDKIQVEFQDLDGNPKKIEAGDLLSRVIQHEVDHLNGKLFFDYLTPLKRAMSKSKLRRIEQGKTQAHYDMIGPNGEEIKASSE